MHQAPTESLKNEQRTEEPLTPDQRDRRRQNMHDQAERWLTAARSKAEQASKDESRWNWFDWLFTVGAAAAAGSGGAALSGRTGVTVALGFGAAIATAGGAVAKKWGGMARDTTYTWRQVIPALETFVYVTSPSENGYPLSTVETEFASLLDSEAVALKSVAAEGKSQ